VADGAINPAREADVQISLGRVAEQQGDLEQAMIAYKAALRRDDRRADAYLRMAVLQDKQGKFRESAELYRKALHMRPGDPEIFCDMGYSFYLQRRWAEAEMNLRQAIAVNPELARAHNNLALVLARDNRCDDALAEFRKAGNKLAEAHLNLAYALTMDQRWKAARAEYERAVALDPSSRTAKGRAAQLNTLLAKFEGPSRSRAVLDERLTPTSATIPMPRRQIGAVTNARLARQIELTDRSPTAGALAAPKNLTVRAQSEMTGPQSVPDLLPIEPSSNVNSLPEPGASRNRKARVGLTRFTGRFRRLVPGRSEHSTEPAGPTRVGDGV
jgi:tetratricopeptide (TPR) repeat protein